MAILKDEVRDLIRARLQDYEANKSHRKRHETLYDYSVDGWTITASMEATESGGAYMMPGLFQAITWTLTNDCKTVEYVEDAERAGTSMGGRPHKRIDVTIELAAASPEELKGLKKHLS